MKRIRISQKAAEQILETHNDRTGDKLSLNCAYGAYKVVRLQPNGGYLDAGRVGRSGYQATPRLALEAAEISVGAR